MPAQRREDHVRRIPYSHQPHPESGASNTALGMWLFLASEAMFFGSLFSSYALLRLGAAGADWPGLDQRLRIGAALLATALLVLSNLAVVRAWLSAREGGPRGGLWLAATGLPALGFVALLVVEARRQILQGLVPSTDIYTALLFTFGGVLVLHVLGGLLALLWLARSRAADSLLRMRRIELFTLFWHFVAAMWLVTFPLFTFL